MPKDAENNWHADSPNRRLRTRPLNSAAAICRMCPSDPPGYGSVLGMRPCAAGAMLSPWRAGRKSCRSLDGFRAAQTDRSRSNQCARIAGAAAWPMNRKAKTKAAALRRGQIPILPYRADKSPEKKKRTQVRSCIFNARIMLVSFWLLGLMLFSPQEEQVF